MSNMFVLITPLHVVFLIGVFVILTTMILRKDTPLVCICFLFLFGLVGKKSFLGGVSTIFTSILYAASQFLDIIITIALITALSKCLSDLKSDQCMMQPMSKIMRKPTISWWILGITMFLFSLFLWPSPAVALVGAIMIPFAIKKGLSPIMAAMAMNLFGHGIALSSDYVIQGAPAISATAAGIATSSILSNGFPLFLTMSIVTAFSAFVLNKKDMKLQGIHVPQDYESITSSKNVELASTPSTIPNADNSQHTFDSIQSYKKALTLAIVTPIAFLLDIILLFVCKLRGQDATALITGTAVFLLVFGSIIGFGKSSLEKLTIYVKDGFLFAIEIFAPVIIIGAFFFLGGDGLQTIISDQYRNGILNDWALYLAYIFPLNSYVSAFLSLAIGALTGLDGSGFSGLPLTGSLAQTFSIATHSSPALLATLGQIGAIFVGGGTIVPWGLIPVAAICHVNPLSLARKNLLPVCIGFGATLVVSFIMLSI